MIDYEVVFLNFEHCVPKQRKQFGVSGVMFSAPRPVFTHMCVTLGSNVSRPLVLYALVYYYDEEFLRLGC
jgi:hypothetical protein